MTSELVDELDRRQYLILGCHEIKVRLRAIYGMISDLHEDMQTQMTDEQEKKLKLAESIVVTLYNEFQHECEGRKVNLMKYANEYVNKLKERR